MSAQAPASVRGYTLRTAATGMLNGALSGAIVLVMLPLIVARLGLETYGTWSMLSIFIALAGALDLGLARAIVMHSAGRSKEDAAKAVGAAALLASVIAALAIAAIVSFGTLAAKSLPALSALDRPSLLAAGGSILVLSMACTVARAVLEARFAAHWVNVGYLLQTVLFYSLTLAVATVAPSGPLLLAAPVFAIGVVFVVHLLQIRSHDLMTLQQPTRMALVTVAKTAWQSYIVAAPTAILPPLLGLSFLASSAHGADYGKFDLAYRIATLSATLLASVAVPLLALSAANRSELVAQLRVRDWTRRTLVVTCALFALGLVTFVWLGRTLLQLLFPSAGPALFPLTLWLLVGAAAIAAVEPATRALLGQDQRSAVFIARSTMLVVVVTAMVIDISAEPFRSLGVGYAVAGTLAAAITLCGFVVAFRRPFAAP